MRVFVLGAGASRHAGYPLTAELTRQLVAWLEKHSDESRHFRMALDALQQFGLSQGVDDIESILDQAANSVKGLAIALGDSIEGLFIELRRQAATRAGYASFARGGFQPGDAVITFNYDDAVETALKSVGKWKVWDGYGFTIREPETIDRGSPSLVLKLHGSVNWWASLFAGRMGASAFDSRHILGLRPVISDDHMIALGYHDERDPACPKRTAKLQVMIAPFRKKRFFFSTSYGDEYGDFFDSLWQRAEDALSRASVVYVAGYSMPQSDERARELLLERIPRTTPVRLFCGSRGVGLSDEFKKRRFTAVSANGTHFEHIRWPDSRGES